jgi:hypothetical protein
MDAPTMASAGARSQRGAVSSFGDDVVTIQQDDEDQDETVVAKSRGEASPLQAPPMFPLVPPAAGHANPPPEVQRRPPPQAFAQSAAFGDPGPPMPSPPGHLQPPPQQPPQRRPDQGPSRVGEAPFDETMGMPQSLHGRPGHDANAFGLPVGPQNFLPRSEPHPTRPQAEAIPRQSPRMQPTVPRLAAPAYDHRTMTAQRFKRRPPMWVVAALSCSIALLIAGIVIAIVSSTSGSPTTPKAASPGTLSVDRESAPAAGGTAGPFGSARAAFNAVVSAQPASAAPPVATPPGAPPAAVTAPPVMTFDTAPPPAAATPTPVATTPTPVAAAPKPAPAPQPLPAPLAAPLPKKSTAPGFLTIVCMPRCDQIIDNGTPLGPGHVFNKPVASGRHVLQLSAPNGARKNMIVDVVSDQTREVRISMDR